MGLLGFDGPLGPLQFYKSSKVTIALTILASCLFATVSLGRLCSLPANISDFLLAVVRLD